MRDKKREPFAVPPTRAMTRARARRAYDELSRRWRDDRRSQRSLIGLGLEVPGPVLGRKPPFSVFLGMLPKGEEPGHVVRESSPVEFLEYARVTQTRWTGDVPPWAPRGTTVTELDGNPHERRGVETIDIAGGDED